LEVGGLVFIQGTVPQFSKWVLGSHWENLTQNTRREQDSRDWVCSSAPWGEYMKKEVLIFSFRKLCSCHLLQMKLT